LTRAALAWMGRLSEQTGQVWPSATFVTTVRPKRRAAGRSITHKRRWEARLPADLAGPVDLELGPARSSRFSMGGQGARDAFMAIRRVLDRRHHIVQWSEFTRGGHFAALEAPDLLVDDIRTFFRRVR
jgi:pimeloyl-ACP methyl ester carboxylesterase